MIYINEKTASMSFPTSIDGFIMAGNIKDYSIDFIHQRIDVFIDKKNGYKKDFGKYYSKINNYISKIISDYKFHKKHDEKYKVFYNGVEKEISLTFLDEIHLVGILYINKIIEKEPSKMKRLNECNDEDIICEIDQRRNLNSNNISGFPIFDTNSDFSLLRRFRDLSEKSKNDETLIQRIEKTLFYTELLGSFYKKDHAIYLCPKYIEKTFNKLKELNCCPCYFTLDSFTEIVLLHEFGHSVFQKFGHSPIEPIMNETRANYFVSFMTNGLFDEVIEKLTSSQPIVYSQPYLSFSFMLKKAFDRHYFYGSLDYDDLKKEYMTSVGVLYGLDR